MYRKYFGLLRKPFELSPGSSIFFLSETHKRVLGGLRKEIADDTSFVVLTGGEGTGKTTVLNALVSSLEIPGHLCVLTPPLESAGFFSCLGSQLGLPFKGNKAKFLVLFANLLEEARRKGKKIIVIVDEAHVLPVGLLEDLRLLANLATEVKSVLSILLIGLPELVCRLTREQLFLLNQRIAVRYDLDNLTKEDCLRYVMSRLVWAGAEDGKYFFSEKAGELIYEATGGNPRHINMLCDNALLAAYSQGVPAIDEELMRECVERLHFGSDDGAFLLPPESRGVRKWLVWVVMVMVILDGAGVAYAYQQGWLMTVCQYLMRSIKLG